MAYLYGLCLTYTVRSSNGLKIYLWIPIAVGHNDRCCFCEVDAWRVGREQQARQ
jgi:hypothetical protein